MKSSKSDKFTFVGRSDLMCRILNSNSRIVNIPDILSHFNVSIPSISSALTFKELLASIDKHKHPALYDFIYECNNEYYNIRIHTELIETRTKLAQAISDHQPLVIDSAIDIIQSPEFIQLTQELTGERLEGDYNALLASATDPTQIASFTNFLRRAHTTLHAIQTEISEWFAAAAHIAATNVTEYVTTILDASAPLPDIRRRLTELHTQTINAVGANIAFRRAARTLTNSISVTLSTITNIIDALATIDHIPRPAVRLLIDDTIADTASLINRIDTSTSEEIKTLRRQYLSLVDRVYHLANRFSALADDGSLGPDVDIIHDAAGNPIDLASSFTLTDDQFNYAIDSLTNLANRFNEIAISRHELLTFLNRFRDIAHDQFEQIIAAYTRPLPEDGPAAIDFTAMIAAIDEAVAAVHDPADAALLRTISTNIHESMSTLAVQSSVHIGELRQMARSFDERLTAIRTDLNDRGIDVTHIAERVDGELEAYRDIITRLTNQYDEMYRNMTNYILNSDRETARLNALVDRMLEQAAERRAAHADELAARDAAHARELAARDDESNRAHQFLRDMFRVLTARDDTIAEREREIMNLNRIIDNNRADRVAIRDIITRICDSLGIAPPADVDHIELTRAITDISDHLSAITDGINDQRARYGLAPIDHLNAANVEATFNAQYDRLISIVTRFYEFINATFINDPPGFVNPILDTLRDRDIDADVKFTTIRDSFNDAWHYLFATIADYIRDHPHRPDGTAHGWVINDGHHSVANLAEMVQAMNADLTAMTDMRTADLNTAIGRHRDHINNLARQVGIADVIDPAVNDIARFNALVDNIGLRIRADRDTRNQYYNVLRRLMDIANLRGDNPLTRHDGMPTNDINQMGVVVHSTRQGQVIRDAKAALMMAADANDRLIIDRINDAIAFENDVKRNAGVDPGDARDVVLDRVRNGAAALRRYIDVINEIYDTEGAVMGRPARPHIGPNPDVAAIDAAAVEATNAIMDVRNEIRNVRDASHAMEVELNQYRTAIRNVMMTFTDAGHVIDPAVYGIDVRDPIVNVVQGYARAYVRIVNDERAGRAADVGDRDRRIGDLTRDVADLTRDIGDRERRINDLTNDVNDRNRRIADLTNDVNDRNRRIADLTRDINDRERDILNSTNVINALGNICYELYVDINGRPPTYRDPRTGADVEIPRHRFMVVPDDAHPDRPHPDDAVVREHINARIDALRNAFHDFAYEYVRVNDRVDQLDRNIDILMRASDHYFGVARGPHLHVDPIVIEDVRNTIANTVRRAREFEERLRHRDADIAALNRAITDAGHADLPTLIADRDHLRTERDALDRDITTERDRLRTINDDLEHTGIPAGDVVDRVRHLIDVHNRLTDSETAIRRLIGEARDRLNRGGVDTHGINDAATIQDNLTELNRLLDSIIEARNNITTRYIKLTEYNANAVQTLFDIILDICRNYAPIADNLRIHGIDPAALAALAVPLRPGADADVDVHARRSIEITINATNQSRMLRNLINDSLRELSESYNFPIVTTNDEYNHTYTHAIANLSMNLLQPTAGTDVDRFKDDVDPTYLIDHVSRRLNSAVTSMLMTVAAAKLNGTYDTADDIRGNVITLRNNLTQFMNAANNAATTAVAGASTQFTLFESACKGLIAELDSITDAPAAVPLPEAADTVARLTRSASSTILASRIEPRVFEAVIDAHHDGTVEPIHDHGRVVRAAPTIKRLDFVPDMSNADIESVCSEMIRRTVVLTNGVMIPSANSDQLKKMINESLIHVNTMIVNALPKRTSIVEDVDVMVGTAKGMTTSHGGNIIDTERITMSGEGGIVKTSISTGNANVPSIIHPLLLFDDVIEYRTSLTNTDNGVRYYTNMPERIKRMKNSFGTYSQRLVLDGDSDVDAGTIVSDSMDPVNEQLRYRLFTSFADIMYNIATFNTNFILRMSFDINNDPTPWGPDINRLVFSVVTTDTLDNNNLIKLYQDLRKAKNDINVHPRSAYDATGELSIQTVDYDTFLNDVRDLYHNTPPLLAYVMGFMSILTNMNESSVEALCAAINGIIDGDTTNAIVVPMTRCNHTAMLGEAMRRGIDLNIVPMIHGMDDHNVLNMSKVCHYPFGCIPCECEASVAAEYDTMIRFGNWQMYYMLDYVRLIMMVSAWMVKGRIDHLDGSEDVYAIGSRVTGNYIECEEWHARICAEANAITNNRNHPFHNHVKDKDKKRMLVKQLYDTIVTASYTRFLEVFATGSNTGPTLCNLLDEVMSYPNTAQKIAMGGYVMGNGLVLNDRTEFVPSRIISTYTHNVPGHFCALRMLMSSTNMTPVPFILRTDVNAAAAIESTIIRGMMLTRNVRAKDGIDAVKKAMADVLNDTGESTLIDIDVELSDIGLQGLTRVPCQTTVRVPNYFDMVVMNGATRPAERYTQRGGTKMAGMLSMETQLASKKAFDGLVDSWTADPTSPPVTVRMIAQMMVNMKMMTDALRSSSGMSRDVRLRMVSETGLNMERGTDGKLKMTGGGGESDESGWSEWFGKHWMMLMVGIVIVMTVVLLVMASTTETFRKKTVETFGTKATVAANRMVGRRSHYML